MRRFLLLSILLFVATPLFAAPISEAEFQRLVKVAGQVRADIAAMEGQIKASPALARYEKEFKAAVPSGAPRLLTPSSLAATLKQARLVLMGDDHATAESQTNTLEVLHYMCAGTRPLVLVIEWIDVSHQKVVDRFLAGDIPLTEVRKKISFDQDWGFSWSSYSRILSAAKKLKVPVLLVERLKKRPSLAQRDTLIAGDIVRLARQQPATRFLVVYGEFHILGTNHLGEKLAKAGLAADVKIIGEAESAYWKALRQTLDPDAVRVAALSGEIIYFRGGTPLQRLVAYRKYLMKLTGYQSGDFEAWVSDHATVPVLKSQERFQELHSAPGH